MDLLRMSFSAAVIIMVVIVLRALWLYKLPKKMFLVLWFVAVLRLLIPFCLPSMFSVYFLISQNSSIMGRIEETFIVDFLPINSYEEREIVEERERIDEIVAYVSADFIGQLYRKQGFSFVRRLLPYMSWEVLEDFAGIVLEKNDFNQGRKLSRLSEIKCIAA